VTTGAKGQSSPGFRAQFQAANLWDLVQMECLARTRGVVRVESGGEAGHLYFDDGRIVHAQTRRATGEAAALEILGWDSGSFARCERDWPRLTTIAISYEGLLLKAAQRRDEAGGAAAVRPPPPPTTNNLVAFPNRVLVTEDWEQEVTKPTGLDDTLRLEMTLRLTPSGQVVDGHGADEDTAAAVAYAARLAALVGDLLGLEAFRALECGTKSGDRLFVWTEPGGHLRGARASAQTELAPLRERLGLT
jgi:hypothetical protein